MEVEESEEPPPNITEIADKVSLLKENVMPSANLPPLLVHLRERHLEKLHYVGFSFVLTQDLYRFWSKLSFAPFYICQISPLNKDEFENARHKQYGFIYPYYRVFRERSIQLLSSCFRWMDYKLAMSIMHLKNEPDEQEIIESDGSSNVQGCLLSPYAMKRLEDYTNNFVDYHTILDLVPILARDYFLKKLPVALSYVQESVLHCMDLQNQDVAFIEREMKLEKQQIIAQFNKIMRKVYKNLNDLSAKEIESSLLRLTDYAIVDKDGEIEKTL